MFQGALLIIWLLCIPGIIVGIILAAVGQKTRKAGLKLLLISIVSLIIIPPVCFSIL